MSNERVFRLRRTRSRCNQIAELILFYSDSGMTSELLTDLLSDSSFERGSGRASEERLDNPQKLITVHGVLSFMNSFRCL